MGESGCCSSVAKQHALFGIPLGLVSAGAFLLLFVWLCDSGLQPGTSRFDFHIRSWVHGFASPGLTSIFLFVTQLGSWFVLLSIGVLLAILFLNSRFSEARMLTITMYGAIVLSAVLKLVFHRGRPEPYFGLAVPSMHSFPSAHALVSFCFFSLIAGIISKRTQSRSLRWCAWGLAIFSIALIGLSRIYLGVQYPSSVLAGYAAGIVWMESVKFFAARQLDEGFPRSDDRELRKS
jgi:undecaprenyl-diphosphatase